MLASPNVKNLMSKSFGAEKFLPIYKFIEIILYKILKIKIF